MRLTDSDFGPHPTSVGKNHFGWKNRRPLLKDFVDEPGFVLACNRHYSPRLSKSVEQLRVDPVHLSVMIQVPGDAVMTDLANDPFLHRVVEVGHLRQSSNRLNGRRVQEEIDAFLALSINERCHNSRTMSANISFEYPAPAW